MLNRLAEDVLTSNERWDPSEVDWSDVTHWGQELRAKPFTSLLVVQDFIHTATPVYVDAVRWLRRNGEKPGWPRSLDFLTTIMCAWLDERHRHTDAELIKRYSDNLRTIGLKPPNARKSKKAADELADIAKQAWPLLERLEADAHFVASISSGGYDRDDESSGCFVENDSFNSREPADPVTNAATRGLWRFEPGIAYFKTQRFDIRGKPLKILQFIVENRLKCSFTYADLRAAVWDGDSTVDDGTIRQHVRALRKSLREIAAVFKIVVDDPIPNIDRAYQFKLPRE